jgi:uncharacterized small protein (DUF1192 family)
MPAPSLKERLATRIAAEQAEIARIKADAITNTAEAQKRLAVLQQAADALTPQFEALLAALAAIGVKVLE